MMAELGSGVDHVIVATRDIGMARARYAALGFRLSDPGIHPTRGTVNACIAFPNAYLELLAPGSAACREAFLLDFLARREGGSSIALAMHDTASVHAALASEWPGLEAPVRGSREIHARDAVHTIAFDVQRVPADALLPGRWFFCRHLDRDRVYDPNGFAHPNGARRISRIVVSIGTVPTACPPALRKLGWRTLESRYDCLRLDAGGIELVFAHPTVLRRWLEPGDYGPGGDGPEIAQIEFEAPHDARVSADQAHGVALRFRAR